MDSSGYRKMFEGIAFNFIIIGFISGIVFVGLVSLIFWLLSHISINWK